MNASVFVVEPMRLSVSRSWQDRVSAIHVLLRRNIVSSTQPPLSNVVSHTHTHTHTHTHRLLLCHVSNGPLILHSEHGNLPHLLFLSLPHDLPVPLLGYRGDHLLLQLLILPLLYPHRVMVLLLDLYLLGLEGEWGKEARSQLQH